MCLAHNKRVSVGGAAPRARQGTRAEQHCARLEGVLWTSPQSGQKGLERGQEVLRRKEGGLASVLLGLCRLNQYPVPAPKNRRLPFLRRAGPPVASTACLSPGERSTCREQAGHLWAGQEGCPGADPGKGAQVCGEDRGGECLSFLTTKPLCSESAAGWGVPLSTHSTPPARN